MKGNGKRCMNFSTVQVKLPVMSTTVTIGTHTATTLGLFGWSLRGWRCPTTQVVKQIATGMVKLRRRCQAIGRNVERNGTSRNWLQRISRMCFSTWSWEIVTIARAIRGLKNMIDCLTQSAIAVIKSVRRLTKKVIKLTMKNKKRKLDALEDTYHGEGQRDRRTCPLDHYTLSFILDFTGNTSSLLQASHALSLIFRTHSDKFAKQQEKHEQQTSHG